MPVDCGYIDCFIRGVCSGHDFGNNEVEETEPIVTQSAPPTFDNNSIQVNNYGHISNIGNGNPLNFSLQDNWLLIVIILMAIIVIVYILK